MNALDSRCSVILPTRNRTTMLRDALVALLGGEEVPAEIVVVDQSDPDHGVAVAAVVGHAAAGEARCSIRLLQVGWCGLSRANNFGVEHAAHDVLLFTHDDVLVDPRWIAHLSAHVRRLGSAGAVTGRVAATDPEVPNGFAPALRDEPDPTVHRGDVGRDVVKPMNLGMTRQVFERIGGFDARLGPGTPFPGAEDADIGLRLLDEGCVIEYDPMALVHHRSWRSPEAYLPLRWHYGVAQGAFYAKHTTRRDLRLVRRAVGDVGRRMRRFPRRLVRERSRALGDPLFVVGNVVGAVRWWWLRRRPGAA